MVLPLASCVTMKSYSALLLCLIFALATTCLGLPYSPLAEIKQGVQKTVDIGSQVVDFTPGLDEITAAGKDLVLGTPFQLILEGFNQVCSLALATEGDVKRSQDVIPKLGDVRIKFLDNKHNRSFNVQSVGELVQMETFSRDNPTVIVTTGWLSMRGNKTSRSAEKLLRAYQCRGNHNFIVSYTSPSSLLPATDVPSHFSYLTRGSTSPPFTRGLPGTRRHSGLSWVIS